ncbi:MAG: hypothetical protein ACOYM2_14225 [Rectinemataceae bacterium]
MNRIIILALAGLFLAQMAFGQSGDARAAGLSGAMTAVTDDANALLYNPAGLAFLRKGYLVVEGMGGLSASLGGFETNSALPEVSQTITQGSSGQTYGYSYFDRFLGISRPFDFESVRPGLSAFIAGVDPSVSWDSLSGPDKLAWYQKYSNLESAYRGFRSFGPLVANPTLELGGRYWALSFAADLAASPQFPLGFTGTDTTMNISLWRNIRAVGGLGFNLGPLAFGGNLRYQSFGSTIKKSSLAEFSQDPQALLVSLLPEFLSGDMDPASLETSIKAGLGALLTVGPLNMGLYENNLLGFLEKGSSADPAAALLNNLNAGFSFMPSDWKSGTYRFPLVFQASVDVQKLGDDRNREFKSGVEAGLDLGDTIVILVRAGYGQPLPGHLSEIATGFDAQRGTLSGGLTAKLSLLRLDGFAELPMSTLLRLGGPTASGTLTPEERLQRFGSMGLSASLRL